MTTLDNSGKKPNSDLPGDSGYLARALGDALSNALSEIVHQRPSDPIEFLALWLRKHAANLALQQQEEEEARLLQIERTEAEMAIKRQEELRHEALHMRTEEERRKLLFLRRSQEIDEIYRREEEERLKKEEEERLRQEDEERQREERASGAEEGNAEISQGGYTNELANVTAEIQNISLDKEEVNGQFINDLTVRPRSQDGRQDEPSESRARTPKSRVATPPSRTGTPKSRAGTPTSRVESPKSRPRTPNSRVGSPKSRVESPKLRVGSPKSRVDSPNSRVESPKPRAVTPPSRAATPKSQDGHPRSQGASPGGTPRSARSPGISDQKSEITSETYRMGSPYFGQNEISVAQDASQRFDSLPDSTVLAERKSPEETTSDGQGVSEYGREGQQPGPSDVRVPFAEDAEIVMEIDNNSDGAGDSESDDLNLPTLKDDSGLYPIPE